MTETTSSHYALEFKQEAMRLCDSTAETEINSMPTTRTVEVSIFKVHRLLIGVLALALCGGVFAVSNDDAGTTMCVLKEVLADNVATVLDDDGSCKPGFVRRRVCSGRWGVNEFVSLKDKCPSSQARTPATTSDGSGAPADVLLQGTPSIEHSNIPSSFSRHFGQFVGLLGLAAIGAGLLALVRIIRKWLNRPSKKNMDSAEIDP